MNQSLIWEKNFIYFSILSFLILRGVNPKLNVSSLGIESGEMATKQMGHTIHVLQYLKFKSAS